MIKTMEEIMPTEQICVKCRILKPMEEFPKEKTRKFGRRSRCKICEKSRYKKYYQENTNKVKLKNLRYNTEYPQKRKLTLIKYHQKYPNARKIASRKYYFNNQKKCSDAAILCAKKRYHSDPLFKTKELLRKRIKRALTNKIKKSATTENLLGCSIEHAKTHIESQFKPGMSWDNHGIKKWHIDHIRPCASFDLSKPEEQAKCFHYTNLQPLWATTKIARQNGDFESIGNLEKGDSLEVGV